MSENTVSKDHVELNLNNQNNSNKNKSQPKREFMGFDDTFLPHKGKG